MPLRVLDLAQQRLQAIFKFAAILGAGHQRPQIQGYQTLGLERLGDIRAYDALRQTFDDGSLAHSWLANQHGIVLGAAQQHLDHAPDFVIPADHWVEPAPARQVGKIAGIERKHPFFGLRG